MAVRRVISAGVLLLLSAALHHTTFTSHLVDDTGAVFERETLGTDSHHEGAAHLCADLVGADDEAHACLAVLPVACSGRAPSHHASVSLSVGVVSLVAREGASPQVALLTLAPKNSPPSPC